MISPRLLSYGLSGISVVLVGLLVACSLGRASARREATRERTARTELAADTTRLGQSLRTVRHALGRQSEAVRRLEREGDAARARRDAAAELVALERRTGERAVQRVLSERVAAPAGCPERGATDYLTSRASQLVVDW